MLSPTKENIMKKIAIVALLSAFVATPALADNSGRFYMGGDLGAASFSNANLFFAAGGQATFPNPGVIRIAGGFHFNPMVAVEVGYAIFGDSILQGAGGSFTLQARSLQVAAVGSLPLSPQFDLIGKAGLSNNSYTVKTTGNAFMASGGTSSQSDILLGIGAQFHINPKMALRAQYESFGKFDNYAQPMTATALSIGMIFDF
jgi:OOP family OmpA-OmpF porin